MRQVGRKKLVEEMRCAVPDPPIRLPYPSRSARSSRLSACMGACVPVCASPVPTRVTAESCPRAISCNFWFVRAHINYMKPDARNDGYGHM